MSDDEDRYYDAELRQQLLSEAEDPELTAQLIEAFEAAHQADERARDIQQREFDELLDRVWDDEPEEDDEDDEEDGPLSRIELRESLAEARPERIVAEKTLEHHEADWQRTHRRITEIDERFPGDAARPEVVEVELGGLYARSQAEWAAQERQELVVELARQRERHYEALLELAGRVRSLERISAPEPLATQSSVEPGGTTSLVVAAAVVAAVIFAGAGLHELNYVADHPHAYGPAQVIAWVCGAGLIVAAAAGVLARSSAS